LGYKLWDNINCRIIRSRDVVFNENNLYKDRNLQVKEEEKSDAIEFDVDTNVPILHEGVHEQEPQTLE